MDNKFSDTHIWSDGKYSWMTWNKATGIGATGQDRAEAEKTFRLNWGDRGEINWIETPPPPPPKREGEKPPIEGALEQQEHLRRGYAEYKAILKSVHPDTNPAQQYTATEVATMINRLWESCR
jgi:hypothetical protein